MQNCERISSFYQIVLCTSVGAFFHRIFKFTRSYSFSMSRYISIQLSADNILDSPGLHHSLTHFQPTFHFQTVQITKLSGTPCNLQFTKPQEVPLLWLSKLGLQTKPEEIKSFIYRRKKTKTETQM